MNPLHSEPLLLPAPDYASLRGTEQDLKENGFSFPFLCNWGHQFLVTTFYNLFAMYFYTIRLALSKADFVSKEWDN